MIIYDALKKDHVKLKELLNELVHATEAGEESRNDLISKIRDELVPHSRAEEAVFYNSLREIDQAHSLAMHGYREHMEAETLLRSLQVTGAVNINWTSGARKLKEALEHHISEEEGELFSAAQQLFTNEEAKEMGIAFEKMKPEIKEGSFVKSTVEMIANMMPSRLRDAFQKSEPPKA